MLRARRSVQLLAAISALFGATFTFERNANATPPFVATSRTTKPLVSPSKETPERALVRMLAHAGGAELLRNADVPLDGGARVVHFAQRHRGVAVIGRGASVRLDALGHGVLAAAKLEANLPRDVTPTVDVVRARSEAQRRSGLPEIPGGKLAIAPLADRGVLVWHFEPRFPGLPFAPRILVDAKTGEVILMRDRAVAHAPTGRVFAANPTRTPGASPMPLAIEPTFDRLESDRIVAKSCVDRKKVFQFPGLPNGIHACELVAIAKPTAEGHYDAQPDDAETAPSRNEDAFAEVSMYYHLARAYSFFETLAPPGTTKIIEARPFTAVANLRIAQGLESGGDLSRAADPERPLVPFPNAFFAPEGDIFGQFYEVKGGALWFGQGKRRDYAYDGDVVYHEFAHAIVDATIGLGAYTLDSQGLSGAPGALNEGIADVFSAALTGDPDLGEYAASDVRAGQPYVRTLANNDRCPAKIVGEVHFDSTAFSGALWSVRAALSTIERRVFDRTLYETLITHPKVDAPTFEEFAELLLETFALRSSVATRAIEQELRTRGLYPSCERVIEATERSILAPTDAAGKIGFQAPGKFELGVPLVAGVVTFRAALDAPLLPSSKRMLNVAFQVKTSTGLFFQTSDKPFLPRVLVKWDAPISYTGAASNADATADLKENETNAAIEIPEGAKVAYVQIANVGERAGIYDAVKITTQSTVSLEAPTAVDDEPLAESSGCALGTRSASKATTWAPWAALVATAFALARRRRRS